MAADHFHLRSSILRAEPFARTARPRGRSLLVCKSSSSGFADPEWRAAAKALSRLFYADSAPTPQPPIAPVASAPTATSDAGLRGPAAAFDASGPEAAALADLPLWRADSVVLPGQQTLLHVHSPAYVHMFNAMLLRAPARPWLFGHVRLPGGSRNLGGADAAWALCGPGSAAPTVGSLMEVHRAVRLEDGKLMVLATALCRIKVLHCLQQAPFSRGRCAPLHERELLEAHHAEALGAALDADVCPVGVPACPVDAAVRVAAAAAAAAATAASWRWLSYEAAAARGAAWGGRCPAEGASPAATRQLVSDLVDHGVLNVVPLPDGPVVGRWDLAALGLAAAADAAAALAAEARAAAAAVVAEAAQAQGASGGGAGARGEGAGGAGGEGGGAGLGTGMGSGSGLGGAAAYAPPAGAMGPAAEAVAAAAASLGFRDDATQPSSSAPSSAGGAAPVPPEPSPSPSPPSPAASGAANPSTSGSGAGPGGADDDCGLEPDPPGPDPLSDVLGRLTGHSRYDLLVLEGQLWEDLDALAVLTARVHQRRLGLPLGMLQLRPDDDLAEAQLAEAAPPAVLAAQAQAARVPASGAGAGASGVGVRSGSGSEAAAGGAWAAQAGTTGTAQPRVHPASEGLDVYAHPCYPPERRALRLAYAAASIFIEASENLVCHT
ncbi:hypothetical protein HYH03_009117 [Edaphochlamys debaryana]|uniref:Lon N-terminal domain-containing protein n=1 Tax=Edaphochlamys debaryana TaxID=47281 RepID=A0A835XZR1_9CHLO|nr:hypothetical protein HYH03_009117 [Edaphochlamys debaryana]|eukprot:KAG2492704.1 hypothetical protein HYH03_009117 [Edaphochlamys debaryana]